MPAPISPNQIETLEERLTDRLPLLSYLAFAIIVRRILSASGMGSVRLSERYSLRGRSNSAGVDLRAVVDEPLGPLPVLVQLKLTRKPVGRRTIDQLRSCLLAEGVSHGIVVTTGTFSHAAIEAAAEYPGRPLQLIDVSALTRLMVEHRIGISEGTSLVSGKQELFVNENALVHLELACRVHLRKRKGAA